MANETVSITQSVNKVTITDINAGVDSFGQLSDTTISSVAGNELLQYDASSTKWVNRTLVEAGVAGLAGSNFTGVLNVGSNGSGHDVKFFGATSGKYLQWDASADKLTLSGDLDISGTTTTLNSNVVTIDDPVFTIGGDTAPSSDDNKDRGIEFRYHDGSTPRVGFFGYDDSESAFTFLTSATNSSEVFSGTLGNLKTASITLTAGTLQLDSAYAIQWGNGNNRIFGSSGNNYIRFDTNGAEAMRLESNGRLGISTTAPSHKLNVVVSASDDGIILNKEGSSSDIFRVTMDGTNDRGELFLYNAGTPVFAVRANSNYSYINTGANFGISTTTPSAKLDVQLEAGAWNVGSSFSDKSVRISGGSGGLGLAYDDTTGATIAAIHHGNSWKNLNFGAVQYTFDINGSQVMRLNSTGLGIGGSPIAQTYIESDNNSFAGTGTPSNYHLVLRNPQNDLSEGVGIGFTSSTGTDSIGAAIAFERTDNQAQGDLIFSAKSSTSAGASLNELMRLDGSTSSIVIPDSIYMQFGNGGAGDLRIEHDGTNSTIKNHQGNLTIQNRADNKDIIFSCDDGSGGNETYFFLDGSASSGNPITNFPDNSFLSFGSSHDFSIYHDSTNTYIANSTNHLYIQNNADDKDIIFRCDDGSGGVETYFYLDGSASSGNPVTNFPDNSALTFGNDRDYWIYHDGTDSRISNYVGDLVIRNYADDKDIVFVSDDGSGNTTTYFRLDGSAAPYPRTTFVDNSILQIGDGGDLQIFHDTADSFIRENTRHLYIQNTADDSDIVFQSDDGSGGLAQYIRIDGSAGLTQFDKDTKYSDSKKAVFGNSGDLQIFHDGTHSKITNNVTGSLYIQSHNSVQIESGNGEDMITCAADGAVSLFFDNNKKLQTTTDGISLHGNGYIDLPDNGRARFGAGYDLAIYHDGSHSYIKDEGTGGLYLQTNGPAIYLQDTDGNGMAQFTDGGACFLMNDGAVKFQTTADGVQVTGDILAYTASGQYFQLDHSDNSLKLSDNVKLKIGTGSDFQIFHTGTNTTMLDQGTGALVIASNNLRVLSANQAETLFEATEDGAVELYHNNSKKFETTSDGATVTGDLVVNTGHVTLTDNGHGVFTRTLAARDGNGINIREDSLTSGLTITDAGDTVVDNNLTVGGNLTVSGTTTTIDTANLTVEDKNIIIGNVSSPSDTTADGGGFTLKGASDYTIQWTDATNRWQFNQGIQVDDSSRFVVGSSGDASFYHNGTLTYLENATGDLTIRNLSDGDDIIIQTDNGSGGVENYLQFDGGGRIMRAYRAFRVQDDVKLQAGSAGDLDIKHTSDNSYIENHKGHLYVTNTADDSDIKFRTDNGSGGVAEYFRLDGGDGRTVVSKNFTFLDDVAARFGGSNDLVIIHDGTDSKIRNTGGDLIIQQEVDDKDIIFKCDDGSGGLVTYFYLDGSYGGTVFNRTATWTDDDRVELGTGSDLRLYHNGSNSYIENTTGSLDISNAANDEDILFKCDDGSGGLATYFYLDGSLADGTYLNTRFNDNSRILLGTGGDLVFNHDGTNSYIDNETGDLYIRAKADDKDLIFQCDDGSGGTETYFFLDGSASSGSPFTVFPDNSKLTFGWGNDLILEHNGADSYISNYTGHLYIRSDVDNSDVRLQASGGSGTASDYIILDSSQTSVRLKRKTKLDDSLDLCFGDGEDLKIGFDGTNSTFSQTDGDMRFIQYTDNKMIRFYNDDGSGGISEYFRVDGSANNVNFSTTAHFIDNAKVALGGGHDLQIWHDGSSSIIQNDTGHLDIKNTSNDADIRFMCDDGSGGVETYFACEGDFSSGHPFTVFPDNSRLSLGNGADTSMYHTGSVTYFENNTGDWYFLQGADDKDIIFQCDDGSGGTETYFFLDGSVSSGNPYTTFPDNSRLTFGSGRDLQIMHNGTNTVVENLTGNLSFINYADDSDIIFQSDNNSGGVETYFYLDGSINSADAHTVFPDSSRIILGSGTDTQLYHDGSNSYISHTGTGDLYIQNTADNKRIRFVADDGAGGTTAYFDLNSSQATHDGSDSTMLVTSWYDNSRVTFGNSIDFQLWHDSTNSRIYSQTGDLKIQQAANDKDITFECDDGSGGMAVYFKLDGSLVNGTSTLGAVNFPDKSKLLFGTGSDLQLYHNGTNSYITNGTGDLIIYNSADDKDIVFQSDDGSGGIETYFRLDGSKSTGNPYTIFPNSSFLGFGDDGNLLINHGGSSGSASIQNNGGDINITQNTNDGDVTFFNDDGSGSTAMYLSLDGGREVVKHHRGVEYNIQSPNNSDYTVTSSNYVIRLHSLTQGRTVTIPTAQCNEGRVLVIKDGDGNSNTHNITIATGGSETIDGAATKVINTAYDSVTLISDGSNWFII